MKRKTTILFILTITITSTFFTSAIIAQGNSAPQIENELSTNLLAFGEYAVDWSLKEVKSDITRSMSYYRGKVVILEFFSTMIDQYKDQFLPYLKAVRLHYTSSQLAIVSINGAFENESVVEQFALDHNINWDVFVDTKTVNDDYDVRALPTFYIIDKNQFINYAHVGIVDDNFFISKIDPLVDDRDRTPSEWWLNNWYWIVLGIIVVGIVSAMFIQRRRVILHNRKVDEQTIEARRRKRRRKER